MIEGVLVSKLQKIFHSKGDIYHALKKSDSGYASFGEAYFSNVHMGDIKGWKKHSRMILNLVVPVGSIRFVMYDGRKGSSTYQTFMDVIVGSDNYARITVPPGVWMAFQGAEAGQNLLLNIANIEHDPHESLNCSLEDIVYNW